MGTIYEIDRMFFGKTRLGESAMKKAQKITFEFCVNIEYKNRFLQLIHNLSVPEFGVDVDLKDIWTRPHHNNDLISFRVKASGIESNLERWKGNIKQVLDFLNGENCLTYTKTVDK
jgi:hypothetical protein